MQATEYLVFLGDYIRRRDVVEFCLLRKVHVAVGKRGVAPIVTFEEQIGLEISVEGAVQVDCLSVK